MLPFNRPIAEIVRQRYSCRMCEKTPVAAELAGRMESFAGSIQAGPLGTPLRFELAAREIGLAGTWQVHEPDLQKPGDAVEYAVTWISAD